jgi:hypothetical protein
MKSKYSDKELALISFFGFSHLVGELPPEKVYQAIVNECFINKYSGGEVISLRRVWMAILNGNPYRLTPEFDDLILD